MTKNDFANVRVLLVEGFARQVMPMMEYLRFLGCKVATLNASKLDMGYSSRYPNERIVRPDWDRKNEDRSFEVLLEELKRGRFDIAIPLTDFSATMMARRKKELDPFVRCAVNDWDVFIKAADKQNTMMICADEGLPCPKTLSEIDSLEEVLDAGLPYPIVVKPRVGCGSVGFHRVDNEAVLREVFQECGLLDGGILVQEYIPQTGMQYKCELLLDDDGLLKSAVVFDKSRWFPVDGGSSCCNTTVDRPDIIESCASLLKAISWRGYADVDLIEDPRDGTAKIMEINPRITGSVKICFDAGVNFAQQIVELETGREVTAYPTYRMGCVMRYLHTDIFWFLRSPNRMRSNPSWFSWKNTTDQIWSRRDPKPWFTYTIQGLMKFGPEMKKRKR